MRAPRIESVDLLRGMVMILMALDHTRDFLGTSGVNPTDLSRTTAALFLTRWITHLCAPVFFLLTGVGASLAMGSKSRAELSRFLLTRGLWLLVLEVTIFRCLAMQFNFDYHVTMLIVLWALGWAMIVLAALVYLPRWAVGAFAVAMLALTDLLDPIRAATLGRLAPLWTFLHQQGVLFDAHGYVVFVAYPIVPWIAVTAAGFALGGVYTWPGPRRRRFLLRMGIGLSAAFVLLRVVNGYGDPSHWAAQKSTLFTVFSFFNATKNPPSLLFLLMMLGPALLLLATLERPVSDWLRPALVYGRVPLFYFVLHIALIHLIAVVVCAVRFGDAWRMVQSPDLSRYPFNAPEGWGFSLPWVYVTWILVVAALYPACAWFAALKRRRSDAWLSYL